MSAAAIASGLGRAGVARKMRKGLRRRCEMSIAVSAMERAAGIRFKFVGRCA